MVTELVGLGEELQIALSSSEVGPEPAMPWGLQLPKATHEKQPSRAWEAEVLREPGVS